VAEYSLKAHEAVVAVARLDPCGVRRRVREAQPGPTKGEILATNVA
jgi:hypothetical protein